MGEALLAPFELEEDAGEAGDDAEEADGALVDLGAHEDFGHVGASECGQEVSDEVDELDGDEFALLVDLVEALQELHRRHLLQLLLQLRLLPERLPQQDRNRHQLPEHADEEDGVGESAQIAVGGVSHHHHHH